MKKSVLVLVPALLLAACGGAAAQASSTPEADSMDGPTIASGSPTPSPASAAAGAIAFSVASGSKAVVRVTEQLADRQDLSDAVLTSEKVSGAFTLLPDGSFAQGSRIAVDLNALASDDRRRDGFIKQTTLDTRRFPDAVFVPKRAQGLALPLAASGDLSFTLVGDLTVRGVTKEVAFVVKATRASSDLTATATVTPALRFGTFNMEQPRVFSVLSIKDEIRLEVQLKARQQG